MMARRRLPNRRSAVAFELEHVGHRFRMHVGHFADGTIGEIFIDSAKQNSALDALASDAAILISLLLQHGATPAEIGHALRRSPDGAPASLIGAAARGIGAGVMTAAEELLEAWRSVANAKLDEFRRQAWRFAMLVRQGVVERTAAVDRLWEIAVAHALVRALGEERVEAIIAEAFADSDSDPMREEVA